MIRVALLDDYQGVAMECAPWHELPRGVKVETFTAPFRDLDDAAGQLEPYPVMMAMRERTRFPRELLERLPDLKLLATAGPRNAAIDMQAASEMGIVVCGTGGAPGTTMELTWGLVLAVMRHIPGEHNRMRDGGWQETVGVGLEGKTLGLLGLGNIGAQVAAVAKPFHMRVIAWSENLTAERAAECGAERVDKEDLLAQADVVSIHLRLSERTTALLGSRELALMKRSAYLINTSRGPIVEESALVDALQRGQIAGAGLDVYDVEPLPPGHPLRTLDNVALTPHLGYVTREVYARFYGETLENIRAYLAGQPTRVLNPDVLQRLRPPPVA